MSDALLLEEKPLARGKFLGFITLNDERALNALSLDMIQSLYRALQVWQANPAVAVVFLQGAGDKAFCAGGNVRKIYDSVVADPQQMPNKLALDFFATEYRLDYLIHRYTKPLIVWGHGIVMGGGMGLMAGASHRVVTERSRLAMPEISIGLFPDVGGTWFLNRAPQNTGLFLALTGVQLNAADALFVGLADFAMPHAYRQSVLDQLLQVQWCDDAFLNAERVSRVLRAAGKGMDLPLSNVRRHFDLINQVTEADSLQAIAENLLTANCDDVWWQTAINKFKAGCPGSAHLIYQQLRRGKKLSLAEVFQRELMLALWCVSFPDFAEGVRALLVDKDQKPRWSHAQVNDVPDAWIEQHFRPLWTQQAHPLADLA